MLSRVSRKRKRNLPLSPPLLAPPPRRVAAEQGRGGLGGDLHRSGGDPGSRVDPPMVLPQQNAGLMEADGSASFIRKLQLSVSDGLPHAAPVPELSTQEHELVKSVFQVLQGFDTVLLYWDKTAPGYCEKAGVYVSHLSQTSLRAVLKPFLFAATCLKQVELFVGRVRSCGHGTPTLSAFASSVDSWLMRLRKAALKEEEQLFLSVDRTITLLGLTDSTSSLCSGAEHLYQVVQGAVPDAFWNSGAQMASSEVAVHVVNHLFKKLNEVCLVEDGEGEPYHMLLVIFAGTLLPYLQCLDSWLYDGILDDPYEEMFFYANKAVTIDQPAFWEMSYMLRVRGPRTDSSSTLADNESIRKKELINQEATAAAALLKSSNQGCADILCPVFLKDIARAILSAGKSFQLVQHVQETHRIQTREVVHEFNVDQHGNYISQQKFRPDTSSIRIQDKREDIIEESAGQFGNNACKMGFLTLSESFLICLSGLLENGDHVDDYLRKLCADHAPVNKSIVHSKSNVQETEEACGENSSEKTWLKLLRDATSGRDYDGMEKTLAKNAVMRDPTFVPGDHQDVSSTAVENHFNLSCYENPGITACQEILERNKNSWSDLNISKSFHLPPLNDENIRKSIFGDRDSSGTSPGDTLSTTYFPRLDGTDYKFGFQFDDSEYIRQEDDRRTLESLYTFPTLLPCVNENVPLSEILPLQKDSTLASRALKFIQSMSLRDPLQPVGIIQECLSKCIKRQVDQIGKQILSKLMGDWRLMDELFVLRAIYLLGSGDMLQQFLVTIFDKLDKGNPWDDDFELNTLLQESIRNSADKMLLTAPDSLVVSLAKHDTRNDEETTSISRKGRAQGFGIEALDVLNFTYKVSWPLDLIVNMEALKKYNQVMAFLLKVKRAKFILDETRKWTWKGGGSTTHNFKQHLIVEQKLLHFVDAFHQYVMDRVYHSAWTELCDGMASATTLDEVMEVHEAYLSSIQRQCFVASDKLWALIASRVKTILGLALDFHNIEQTLGTGGTAPAVKARCEMEVDRIEKQFDECVVFLLRILSFKLNVGHFPHLADLVTRINYNHYYMSDSGSFSAIPGSRPRASVESDVYSFGVALLELACGRCPVMTRPDGSAVHLAQRVRELHDAGRVTTADDGRLNGGFDGDKMEHVLVVGLWCAHPDRGMRPAIR
uniref:Gamma-tubulin complex component n=1 Tax=Oryza glumipatula TaxID=40148 RepID=A0A0E0BUZ6_9ORYZ